MAEEKKKEDVGFYENVSRDDYDGRLHVGPRGQIVYGGSVIDGPQPLDVEERAAIRSIGRKNPQPQETPSAPAQEAASPAFVQDEDDLARIKALEAKDEEFYEIQEELREYASRLPEADAERLNRDTKTYLHHYNRIKKIRREVATETLEDSIRSRNPDFEGIERQGSPRPVRQPAEPSRKEQAEYWKNRMSDRSLLPRERGDAELEWIKCMFPEDKK